MPCDLGYIVQHHVPAMMQLLTEELSEYNMQLLTTKCLNTAVMMWYLFLGEQSSLPFLGNNNNNNNNINGGRMCNSPRVCDSRTVQSRGKNGRSASKSTDEWEAHPANPQRVAERFGEQLTKDTNGTEDGLMRTLFYVILTDCDLPRVVRDEQRNSNNSNGSNNDDDSKDTQRQKDEGGDNNKGTSTKQKAKDGKKTTLAKNKAPTSHAEKGKEGKKEKGNGHGEGGDGDEKEGGDGDEKEGGGGMLMRGGNFSWSLRSLTGGDNHTVLSNKDEVQLDRTDTKFFPGHVFIIEKVKSPDDDRLHYNLYQSYINNYDLSGHQNLNQSLSMSQELAEELAYHLTRMYKQDLGHVWDKETTKFWEKFTHVNCSEYEGYQFSTQSFMCFTTCKTNSCTRNLRALVEEKLKALNKALKKKEVDPDEMYGDRRRFAPPRPNTKRGKPNVTNEIPEPLTNREMKEEFEKILEQT